MSAFAPSIKERPIIGGGQSGVEVRPDIGAIGAAILTVFLGLAFRVVVMPWRRLANSATSWAIVAWAP
jgi:hypothetical protein